MVKKKAAKKAAKKKATPKKLGTSKARQDKARKTARRPATKPRSGEQLELIKGVRYTELDRACRDIGDNRDEVNRLKGEGADLELNALKRMRIHGVTGYKNAGVTLMIVAGDEKLRVIKDRDGKASDGGGATNQQDTGAGQDAGEIGDALTEKDPDDDSPDT